MRSYLNNARTQEVKLVNNCTYIIQSHYEKFELYFSRNGMLNTIYNAEKMQKKKTIKMINSK